MKLKKFHKIIQETPDEVRENVKFSMDVLERLHELLDQKFEGKQCLLAKKMGKSESEVSKWFSGLQNFTQKTLIKLSLAFGEPIVVVCTNHDRGSTFEQVKTPISKQSTKLQVGPTGSIEEVQYQSVNLDNKTNSIKEFS